MASNLLKYASTQKRPTLHAAQQETPDTGPTLGPTLARHRPTPLDTLDTPTHQGSTSVVLKAYKAKYRRLPTLGDDVTDDEGEEGDEGADEGLGLTCSAVARGRVSVDLSQYPHT